MKHETTRSRADVPRKSISPPVLALALPFLLPACGQEALAEEGWRRNCRERLLETRTQLAELERRVRDALAKNPVPALRRLHVKLETRLEQTEQIEAQLRSRRAREASVRGALRALADRRRQLAKQCEDALPH